MRVPQGRVCWSSNPARGHYSTCTQTIRLALQAYIVVRHMVTITVASYIKSHNVTRKDVRPVLVLPPLKVREEGWRERGCLDRPH